MWILLFSEKRGGFEIFPAQLLAAKEEGLAEVAVLPLNRRETICASRIYPDDISARTACLIANSLQPTHDSVSGLMNHKARPSRFQR